MTETKTATTDVAVRKAKLEPEVKKAWLEALRSGEYDQTEGTLKSEDGYCCLGVLCNVIEDRFPEIARGAGVMIEEGDGYMQLGSDDIDIGDSEEVLLRPLSDALGITENGDLPGGGSLVSLNDQGATFEEIANRIEEEL